MKSIIAVLFLIVLLSKTQAQGNDSMFITPNNINTSVLKEGTHRYLVYFQRGKEKPRAMTEFWTRKISRTNYNGKTALQIDQVWESGDTITHTTSSYCDIKSMQPFYHEYWWKAGMMWPKGIKTVVNFDTHKLSIDGKEVTDTVTDVRHKGILKYFKGAEGEFLLNWHLDLEVFPTLPYKKGRTFIIPYYDPGTSSGLTNAVYTVTGSATLEGYNNQKIDCWLLTLEEKGNKEVFYISKKSREVLKMVQEINGSIYRYKIKLSYSE